MPNKDCELISSSYDDEFSKSEKIRIFNSIFAKNGGTRLYFGSLKRDIDSNKCYGYFLHLCGELIGSADLGIYGEFVYLINFGLLEEFRGCGLSKLFLYKLINDAIEKFGDNYDGLYLTIDPSNLVAKSLYKSIGFVQKP